MNEWEKAPIVKKNAWEDAPLADQPNVPQSGRFTNAINGINRALTQNVLEAPYNFVNRAPQLVNLLPGTQGIGTYDEMGAASGPIGKLFAPLGKDPILDWADKNYPTMDKVGGINRPDPNRKFDNFIAESIGDTLVPSAFLASKAKMIASGAQKAGPVMSWLTKPYAGRVGAQIAQDVASSVGAGAGAYIADDQEMGPIGSFFTTMLGGGLGNAGQGMVEGAGRDLYAMRNVDLGNGVKAKASTLDDVNKIMTSVTTNKDAAIKNIDDSLALTGEIGMADPTLGPASGDVGLGMLDVMQRSKNPTPFATRDQEIRNSLANEVGKLSNPNADVTAPQLKSQAIIDEELNKQMSGINGLYTQQTTAEQGLRDLQQQAEDLTAPIAARRGQEGRASRLLDEQIGKDNGALKERTQIKNQMFEDSAQGVYVDAPSLAKLVDDVNAEAPKLAPNARLPDYIMKGINKFIAPPGTLEQTSSTANKIPADEVIKLRKYLDSEIASLRSQGDYPRADTLQSFKSKINQTFDNLPEFAKANDYYKENYAPYFAQGYGKKYRDIVQRGSGIDSADTDNIASIFMNSTKGAKEDLNRIREIVPDRAAFDNAEEMYFDAILAKKDLNPKIVRNFVADNQDILPDRLKTKYTNLVQEMMGNRTSQDSILEGIEQTKRAIRDAEGTMRSVESDLKTGPFGKMVAQDPDKYIGNIMGADDRIKQLKTVKDKFQGDEKATEGFKEAIVRNLTNKISGTASSHASLRGEVDDVGRPVIFNRLTKTLDDNREALSVFMSPEEMNSLTRVQKIMGRLGNLQRRATTGSDTIEKLSMAEKDAVDLISAAVNIKFGLVGGGMINRVTREASKFLFSGKRKINAETLLTQAALNPKVAKFILEVTPRTIENGRFFNELNTIMATEQMLDSGDEERQGIKKFTP